LQSLASATSVQIIAPPTSSDLSSSSTHSIDFDSINQQPLNYFFINLLIQTINNGSHQANRQKGKHHTFHFLIAVALIAILLLRPCRHALRVGACNLQLHHNKP
jgi:hypothetical protein